MPYGLSNATLEAIRKVMANHSAVKRVVLYGSRAKGTHKTGSDIDLALEGEDLSFDEILRIESQLDDLDLPYQFDIMAVNRLSHPDLVDHIRRVGCVVA